MAETQRAEWFDRTTIPRGTAQAAVVVFCVVIVLVPLVQFVVEAVTVRPFQEFSVFTEPPTLDHFQRYERALERASVVAAVVRPYTQLGMTRLTRRGNEKVVLGPRKWAFYRPGVRHVLGPGFLPAPLRGDPLSAILDFHRQLHNLGVALLLVPMPGKETVCPRRLCKAYTDHRPPDNADTPLLLARLKAAGVGVFDPTSVLFRSAAGPSPPYLPYDTHWTPAGMDRVAKALATRLDRFECVREAPRRHYGLRSRTVANRGDLYELLGLPGRFPYVPPTRVAVQQVVEAETGRPFTPDPQARILLLGDSFTNIYSDPSLHWGKAAGLAEHLAYHLQRGVDVIALNDGGVNGCRQQLARRPAMLAGKRVVVWQFATRDFGLKTGEWKKIPVRRPPAVSRNGFGPPRRR